MSHLPIVAECDEFVVANKPSGVHMHSQHDQCGIIPILQTQLQCPHLWLVHRIDADTSGLLLVAKNQHAAAQLSELFRQRQIQKYYLAISGNQAKKKQGSIVGDMHKARNGNYKLTTSRQNPAVSHFFSTSIKPGLRLFVLKPYTGQTHQLRVALKSVGAPIHGDNRYGGAPADRLYLHAYQLAFRFNEQQHHYCATPDTGDLHDPDYHSALADLGDIANLPWPDKKLSTLAGTHTDES